MDNICNLRQELEYVRNSLHETKQENSKLYNKTACLQVRTFYIFNIIFIKPDFKVCFSYLVVFFTFSIKFSFSVTTFSTLFRILLSYFHVSFSKNGRSIGEILRVKPIISIYA